MILEFRMALEDNGRPTSHPLPCSIKEFAADMVELFNSKSSHPLDLTVPLKEPADDLKENIILNNPSIKKKKIKYKRRPRLKNSNCKMCNAAFSCVSLLRQHVSIKHFGIAMFVCDTCKKAFTNRFSLKKHLQRYPDKNCVFNCENCDKVFRSDHDLDCHARFHHKLHTCQLCNTEHGGLKNIKLHMTSHHPFVTYFVCSTCNTFFSSKRQRLAHEKYYKGLCNNDPERCTVTSDQTDDIPMSHTLMICHHYSFNITCDLCGALFNTQYQLSTHLKNNHRAITCQLCGVVCYKGVAEMNAHFGDTHPGTPYFICLNCNSLFANAGIRNSHQEYYEGSCVSNCAVCDQKEGHKLKGILNTERLALCACHFSYPKPDQLLQCKMCDAKISGHYSDLQKHALTAHNIQPCEACNKQFISQQLLDYHACPKRHHTLPLTCRKCNILYPSLEEKQLHDIRFHVTPLQCIYCARFVADRQVLAAHYKRFTDGACIEIKD